jgi:very-short-patch-repair endonuclease
MKREPGRSKEAIEFAKSQRATANEFAATVWQWIRNRQCCGQKFRREFPIPPYTVDFCCVESRLVIEIDGAPHFMENGIVHDRARDRFLRDKGYEILRIPGYDVIRDGRSVIERIERFVREHIESDPSPPTPLPETGRGEQQKLS